MTETLYSIPEPAHVGALLGMLFDDLVVKSAPKLARLDEASSLVGVYVNDAGVPVSVCACDIAFAANGGAALSMLLPKVASDAIKGNALTPVMLANLNEILNICTRLLLRDNTPHLRLHSVSKAPDISSDAARLLAAAKRRGDFAITFGKYGAGRLTVVLE